MPLGFRSTFVETISKPFGPHHCLSCLGSVQAFHTRFSGASTTRVMTNSSPAVLAAGLGFALVAVTGTPPRWFGCHWRASAARCAQASAFEGAPQCLDV